jgi:hypothetical protein
LHIHRKAWIIISGLLFFMAWFIPFGGKWEGFNGWSVWGWLFRVEAAWQIPLVLMVLALYSAIYLVPSLLIGWILQYFVGLIQELWKERSR